MEYGSVRLTESEKMMRDAWMAYDKDGNCVACGVLGMGSLKHKDESAVEIRAGLDAYKTIIAQLKGEVK